MQVARLATELSYTTARAVLSDFVPSPPSTEVIEQTMLGLGAHAEAWFELQPALEDDGEVLVIEIDGKAVPTATERELRRRRRKRERQPKSSSPGHRGRDKRARHPKQPRRKKGDKAKNGKMITMVVMYTLRRRGTRRLEGPVNRLQDARRYLQKRNARIRYGHLRRRDLVISTGIVEGAIKHIVARRCDRGGMRWIKERAQAVVQLRCIQINGDWEPFERFVHDRLCSAAQLNRAAEQLQTSKHHPVAVSQSALPT